MKPTCPFHEFTNRRDSFEATGHRQPKTDFSFRPSSLHDFNGHGGRKRFSSIRAVSEDYFVREARHHFATEAAFFVLIAATVSVPLFAVLRDLISWVL